MIMYSLGASPFTRKEGSGTLRVAEACSSHPTGTVYMGRHLNVKALFTRIVSIAS